MAAYIIRIKEFQKLAKDSGEECSDIQLFQAGQTTMGQSSIYADAYLIWQLRNQAQTNWVAFKTYWADTVQEHEDINKLTEENAVFGANSAMESEAHDKKLDAAIGKTCGDYVKRKIPS